MISFWKWYLILGGFFITLQILFVLIGRHFEFIVCSIPIDLIIVVGSILNLITGISLLKKYTGKFYLIMTIVQVLNGGWFTYQFIKDCSEIVKTLIT